MTLDRNDNALGHLQSNVNPCCVKCNYIRRDLPYEVWELIVPALRIASERGMLDSWILIQAIDEKLEFRAGLEPT